MQRRLITLAPDVFAYIQLPATTGVANAVAIATSEGLCLIDTLITPSTNAAFMQALREVSPESVTRVINTHAHIDHVGGNAHFPNAEVWMHADALPAFSALATHREFLATIMPAWAEELRTWSAPLPQHRVAPGARVAIDGDERMIIEPIGTAHSPGDLLVRLPHERVLCVGDLAFCGVTPLVLPTSNVPQWIAALDRVIAEPSTATYTFIAGHGPIGTINDIRRTRDYLMTLWRYTSRAVQRGDAVTALCRDFPWSYYADLAEHGRSYFNLQCLHAQQRGQSAAMTPTHMQRWLHISARMSDGTLRTADAVVHVQRHRHIDCDIASAL